MTKVFDLEDEGDDALSPVQKYRAEMTSLGFAQANVMVHEADRPRLLAYTKKLQAQRLIIILGRMKDDKDFGETLDLMAQRRRPRGIPPLTDVLRLKDDADKRNLSRLERLADTIQKVANAEYDKGRKLAQLKANEGDPELYHLYDEVAMLSAEVYVHGLWAASEWELMQAEGADGS